MKLLSLLAIGLAIALPVAAQSTSPAPEERQPTAPEQTGKAQTKQTARPDRERDASQNNQNVQSNEHQRAQTGTQENVNPNANVRERTRANDQNRSRSEDQNRFRSERREGVRGQERGASVSRSTTVFRNGRETTENLNLRRDFREQSDVHFTIGTHPRDWWLRSYSIVLMDGCHYYLADNGCWYPAYGFDPSCDYPPGVVYCE